MLCKLPRNIRPPKLVSLLAETYKIVGQQQLAKQLAMWNIPINRLLQTRAS